MKTKHIAIIATSLALAGALQAALEPKMKGYTFSVINKLSERPAGAKLAGLGLPSFLPGNDTVDIISFGSRMIDNATPEQRSAQWETLRSKTATQEEILAELGNFTEYKVLSGSVVKDVHMAVSDIRVQIAEAKEAAATAEDEEAKAAAQASLLESYKAGYEALLSAIG